ncbi:hypothetical protein LWI28_014378 [Acer negundo]|uniref:Uncharacterized protein n=1 Tax=Acer negundo TaxID=4023 RepID=A0AAD5JTQ4_ACENE|nr:hypothetical protein LWI28_014378 [Acer negundo]
MLDFGANINMMPYSMYERLGLSGFHMFTFGRPVIEEFTRSDRGFDPQGVRIKLGKIAGTSWQKQSLQVSTAGQFLRNNENKLVG